MVEKLQLVDRKSELARLTGVDDGEEETIINLTVKPGMEDGLIGNFNVGHGTDGRYGANFMLTKIGKNNQFTVLGNINNTNNEGFSNDNDRWRRGGGNDGIKTSRSIGANLAIGGDEDKFQLNGNMMYTNTKNDTRTRLDRIYNFVDSTPTLNQESKNLNRRHNFRTNFRIVWRPDSFNTLNFRPRFNWSKNNNESLSTSLNRSGNISRDSVTASRNTSLSKGNSYTVGGALIFNHRFRERKGRSFSISLNYSLSNTKQDEDSYSWNRFFLLDSINLYDQYLDNHNWNNTFSTRLSWTEPIGNVQKGNFLNISYRFSYNWNNADRDVYDHPVIYTDPLDPIVDYDNLVFNDTLSNRFRNEFSSQDIRFGYKKVAKAYTLDAGLSVVSSMSKSRDVLQDRRSIPEQWVWNYAPYMWFRYKFSKTRSIRADYNGSTSQASIDQLQSVPDYTDPMNITIGNPNLDPSFTHRLSVRLEDFNREAQRALMIRGELNVVQNQIVSKTEFNPTTSARTTTYANVNGTWNANLMAMTNFPFRRRTWTFNNFLRLSFSQQIGFNNALRNRSRNYNLRESFGIAFRPDNLELELRPSYSIQYNTNSIANIDSRRVHTYGGRFNGTYYTPIGIVLQSDLNYSQTSGYSAGFDTKTWLLNASISYEFLKDKSLIVKASAYDLLQQKSNISRTVNANYTQDQETNSLTRYFMFTLTYKFNSLGGDAAKKAMDGPGGRGPGRGPGGPGGPGGGRW